jgi:hypothetical protein
MAAFSDAARVCLAVFLLRCPGVSSATGDASGVGVAVGIGSVLSVGVGDAPLKKSENQFVPEVPPAPVHPARQISDNERT